MAIKNIFSIPEITAVTLKDKYLSQRVEINHTSTIPSSIEKCYETGRIDAFKLNWKPGKPNKPHVYWDSDVAKVVEGMAYDLMLNPEDKKLAQELDKIVALIVSAQQPDGYLNTHFTVVRPNERFTNLRHEHELYCAGHLMEAAVAHFKATGKRNFLDCMCKYADYIDSVFGRGKGKKRGYPGHEEIELALFKLADATGNKRYKKLASYFVNERGKAPNYFVEESKARGITSTPQDNQNLQADIPIRERKTAEGHAVRMMYLAAGMVDTAVADDDEELLNCCKAIFDNVVEKRMFLTGGVGSSHHGECFEEDYRLVSYTAYTESCAAMAFIWFAQRMHNATGEARYLDILEKVLYNGALSGISLAGNTFFYQNPLDNNPDSRSGRAATSRRPWFSCSCCPTNYCRFLPQIGTFLWSENENEVRLNIPAASEFRSGNRAIRVTGGYPYDGKVKIKFLADGDYTLSVRLPSWCNDLGVIDNDHLDEEDISDSILRFKGPWKKGEEIALDFSMPVEIVHSNRNVHDTAGKLALTRGPIVYALESIENGTTLGRLSISADQEFKLGKAKDLPNGTVAIVGNATEILNSEETLYTTEKPRYRKVRFTAIPYALWQNRGDAEVSVWIHEKA